VLKINILFPFQGENLLFSHSCIAIAVTGYAGENVEKKKNIPGGTVFISNAIKSDDIDNGPIVRVKEFHFEGRRTSDRDNTIKEAVKSLEKSVEYILRAKENGYFERNPCC
jgi:nicotinamide mononucleotide (NMN) deamidase PncC